MLRRSFLPLLAAPFAAAQTRRPRVAAIVNSYFPNSHADVFMGRLLQGCRLNGKTYLPRVDVAAMYVDQFPINDMAREQAEEYGAKIYPTVAGAIRCGGNRLAVDGIAVIASTATIHAPLAATSNTLATAARTPCQPSGGRLRESRGDSPVRIAAVGTLSNAKSLARRECEKMRVVTEYADETVCATRGHRLRTGSTPHRRCKVSWLAWISSNTRLRESPQST
jgi:hypothetical protein